MVSQTIPPERERLSRWMYLEVGLHRNGLTYKQLGRRHKLSRDQVDAILEDTKMLMGEEGFAQLYKIHGDRIRAVEPERRSIPRTALA